MTNFEIKAFELTKEDGKRNVAVCNKIRKDMYNKIAEILAENGFEVVDAANGDLAIKTAVDATTENVYYTRLAVSFTDKGLESKIEKKAKAKVEVELPDLFA